VDPFEVRRRVGAVDVNGLEVLDLTNDTVRSSLGLNLEDLTGDDYARAQEVADAARAGGFGGILAPSAAMQGRRTLVVFVAGVPFLEFDRSRVRQPPPRLADLMRLVRLRGDLPAVVRSLFDELAQAGSDLVRRARRRSRGRH
jgi:hypothetical protein